MTERDEMIEKLRDASERQQQEKWPLGMHQLHCRDDRCNDGATCDDLCHATEADLVRLGYDAEIARLAVHGAGEGGTESGDGYGWFTLKDHKVTYNCGAWAIEANAPPAGVHTGTEACAIRPLHDPCHTGSMQDGRTLGDMTVMSVLRTWRQQVRGTSEFPPRIPGLEHLARQPEPKTVLHITEPASDDIRVILPAPDPEDASTWPFPPALASEGHQLSREQIGKHGKDRYPTAGAQYGKLLDEAGELGEALIRLAGARHVHEDDGTAEGCPGCFADEEGRQVRREYADAGLALYALGAKLGLDLIECMRELVAGDTRRFT